MRRWLWIVRYGLWIALAVALTFWEISAYVWGRNARPDWFDHPTISEMVAQFETRGGWLARVAITLLLVGSCSALILHWVAGVF